MTTKASRKAQAALEAAERETKFQAEKAQLWQTQLSRAMQLQLLKSKHNIHEEQGWYFEDFEVNPEVGQESIKANGVGRSGVERVTLATLTLATYDDIVRALDNGFELIRDTLDQREAARAAAEKKAQARASALALLTPEQIRALDIQLTPDESRKYGLK